MRHIFNENIATHFAAFVQQKHKDEAEEGCGAQAVFLYLPFNTEKKHSWEMSSLNFWLPTVKKEALQVS